LGAVSLRFVPRRVTRKRPEKGCAGDDVRIEHGAFVGVLRFDGERGYARLARRRVPGTLTREPALRCDLVPKKSRATGATRIEGTRTRDRDGNGLGFWAKRLSPAGAASFAASDTEARGGVEVVRTVEVKGPAGSVSIADGLTEATVKPPAPFSGEARFEAFKGKQSGTWLGPLSVSFPGKPDVRLAGKAFEGAVLPDGQCSVDRNVICVGI
jgi:hypothetical protein